MKKTFTFSVIYLILIVTSSCSRKVYFTAEIRNKVEAKNIPLSKLQYYVDRDVELRRELSSGDTKVSSGKVKFENGKYIHIIFLKKFTPGVCVTSPTDRIDASFEDNDSKYLDFLKGSNSRYSITAQKWDSHNFGEVMYNGEKYFIQPSGAGAQLMIKKSVVDKLEVEKHKMKGRKLKG